MAKPMWTIVQHSGAGYGEDMTFAKGLEVREVTDGRLQNGIRSRGGLLFETYGKASDYEEEEAYPPGSGLVPNAPGEFLKDYKIDGLKLYVPKEKVK